jgi:hypothetical protein
MRPAGDPAPDREERESSAMDYAPDQLAPLSDVRQEGLRLVQAATERRLPVRLLGGIAIWARCPSAEIPQLQRDYGDVDIISLRKVSRDLIPWAESMGYRPDKLFNALHGAQRLNFTDAATGRPLDVLLDRFAMCHTIELKDRLGIDPVTIPLADLLLTKLQVVRLNRKDLLDLTALLADHPLGGREAGSIDLGRLTSLLGKDWGFEHTTGLNLATLRAAVTGFGLPEAVTTMVDERIAGIVAALDKGRKSLGWQMRARVGERVQWYELPEDVRH